MNPRTKYALVALPFAAFGFLLQGTGPLGAILWPPAPMPTEPTGALLGGFIAYSIFEAAAFGAGIAFLILGYHPVRAAAGSTRLAIPAYLAIGWLLVNWVPHDALHMHVGMNLEGLLALEWGFHGTLILSGAVLGRFLWHVVASSPQPSSMAARPSASGPRPAPGK
ncbi:MAG: hypothetical protein V4510_11250 [bacterium]